ncbi:hypothetical protein [Terriglobus saanensis]|uniref:hypothetical protein n=1 Tax=Terriglobus saanensis TaxID=870903 RepID=UPI000318F727|nr:hypothetical protein [Terriglobus saanensis]
MARTEEFDLERPSNEAVAERVRIGREGLEQVLDSSSVSALAPFLVNAFFGLQLIAKTRLTKATSRKTSMARQASSNSISLEF